MITNKDKSKIKRYICKAPVFCHLELVERPYGDLVKYDNHVKLVAESADQARKEAAERVARAWREHGEGITLRTIRTAILDDSTADHIHDTGEKHHPEITNDYVKKLEDDLAIAVKALEEIKKIGKAGPAFETHFSKLQYIGAVTNDALKEIQE